MWWENGDIRNPIKVHEMCVYLSGGISRNFYVDDMLRSSREIDEAADLTQRIRNICKAVGFILTKFVSNNIEVMKSIQEELFRKSINIKELESGEVQKERVLRVVWIIKTYTF